MITTVNVNITPVQSLHKEYSASATISQLTSELSETSSQLMMKEKELTKLKKDNKLLVKQFRERKDKRRTETIPQVCSC